MRSLPFGLILVGCAKFSGDDTPTPPSIADAGTDGATQQVAARDLSVGVDWPTLAELDPSRDPRAATVRITLVDPSETSRRTEKRVTTMDRGPYRFEQIVSSKHIDAMVEVIGVDERLVGYGERRGWDVDADSNVPVLARARVLYFDSDDREGVGSKNGQLRALGLAPSDIAEPGVDEPWTPLTSLDWPSGLHVTREGRWVVQTGTNVSSVGTVNAFETGTHALAKSVSLSFPPGPAAPVGDGHRVLVAPGDKSKGTIFALADIGAGTAVNLASGLVGGELVVTSIAAAPDGTRVAAVGQHRQAGQVDSYVFLFQVGTEGIRSRKTGDVLRDARGVRFTPDGKNVVVAGSNETTDWATGALVTFPVTAAGFGAPIANVPLAPSKTRAISLFLDPSGNFAFVNNETRYGTNPCCGEMRIVDLAMGKEVFVSGYSGDLVDFEVVAAVQLPYAPRRVFGGQSDAGNNVNGPLVELVGGAKPVKVTINPRGDIGSLHHMATPFGTQL